MIAKSIMILSASFAIVGGLFALAAAAPTLPQRLEIHWSPEENLERLDEGMLRKAEGYINIAAFGIEDVPILQVLTDKAERITVRAYFDAREFELMEKQATKLPAINAFLHSKVQIKIKHSSVYMHLKAYSLDHKVLRFGSANFSPSGEKRQDNDLAFTTDQTSINHFDGKFESMWQRKDNSTR